MGARLGLGALLVGGALMLGGMVWSDLAAGYSGRVAELDRHGGKGKAHGHARKSPASPRRPPVPQPVQSPAGGNCAALPARTIAGYARRAGFSAGQAVTATAVALAESGGRPCAHNPVPPDDSYGLMQINLIGDLGPDRRARFHLGRNTDLYDPATCMRVAYAISAGGTDWSPWTTFTRGHYRRYLDVALKAGGSR